MLVDGQARARVIGEHRVPGRELAKLRRRGKVERERELDAAGDATARRGDAELPEHEAAGRDPPLSHGTLTRSRTLRRQRVTRPRPGEQLERRAAGAR